MTSTEPVGDPSKQPPPTQIVKPKRGSETVTDMVRSLGLIIVLVAVTLIFVPGLLHPGKSEKFPTVDFSDDVAGFEQVTGRAALTPQPVPSGWRANAANLTGPARAEHLHVGFAVPGNSYAGLEESVAPAATFARSVLGASGAIPVDHVTLAGATWQVSNSARGEYSLRRTVHRVTVIITGSATVEQLQSFAAALR